MLIDLIFGLFLLGSLIAAALCCGMTGSPWDVLPAAVLLLPCAIVMVGLGLGALRRRRQPC